MEKERRIKTISAIALIVAVLGLTVAFAVLSANLTINGTAKVEAGTWNIYFNNLSEATLKGGATVDGAAIINTENKTKIQDMNVILTKPMDEVIYTVELKNDGDIDAEISSINGPDLNAEQQQYVEFSAIYNSDKKMITKGDILRGGSTENVTISIKFKKEVTQLPSGELNIPLSYEINYVQTNQKVKDNVHNGESNIPKIDYSNLVQGSIVTLGEEEFYVLENGEKELKLLAKYNLLVGNEVNNEGDEAIAKEMDPKTPGYGRQNFNAGVSLENMDNLDTTFLGTIEFAKPDEGKRTPSCEPPDDGDDCYYGYWVDQSGNLLSNYKNKSLENSYPVYVYDDKSNLYKPIQEYKSYIEELGYSVKEARLITYEEAVELNCNPDEEGTTSAPSWFNDRLYWTGSANDSIGVWAIGPVDGIGVCMLEGGFPNKMEVALRPVIVLNK